MSEVINLDDHRPSMQGLAKCTACNHVWRAVSPIGVSWMECPECHLERGAWNNAVLKSGLHFRCRCGCDVFHISDIYQVYCPVCARHHGDFMQKEGEC